MGKKWVSMRTEEDLIKRMDKAAARLGIPRQALMEAACPEYLHNHGLWSIPGVVRGQSSKEST